MKIHSLEIKNIRGIRHFQHDFQGKNAAILGANGTGKSSILDAIDFLLTGNISRLTGEGTSGISIKKHGPHVDMSRLNEDGFVQASIKLDPHGQRLLIKRRIRDLELQVDPDNAKQRLEEVFRLAEQGQHMLARRQMLNFITAKPGDRASQVQALLDLEHIELTRKSLIGVTGTLTRQFKTSMALLESSEMKVATALGLDRYESSEVLRAINLHRNKLSSNPVDHISVNTIMSDNRYQSHSKEVSANPAIIVENLTNIISFVSKPNLREISEAEKNLRNKLGELRENTFLLRSISQQKLLELGLTLVVDDLCPLCDEPWNREDLKAHLERKTARASRAGQMLKEIEKSEVDLRTRINEVLSNLEPIISAQDLVSENHIANFKNWESRLVSMRTVFEDSLSNIDVDGMPDNRLATLLSDESVAESVDKLLCEIRATQESDTVKVSPEFYAYEQLSRAIPVLNDLEDNSAKCRLVGDAKDRSLALHSKFVSARDEVLGNTYESVSHRFVTMYRQLHRDESEFSSRIYPKQAGLHFDVDFFRRGKHPPNALHSEGHQDSMGLCLYLVLSEKFSAGNMQVMLLDDVVTSVDTGHRKDLARLLAGEFKNRQLIVATHEQSWLKQLNAVGVVTNANTLHIVDWNITSGPIFLARKAHWEKIDRDLFEHDVSAAAAKLRHWAESFFRQVCHNFQIEVKFKINGSWELADFMQPTLKALRKCFKEAKSNAHKSKRADLLATIKSADNRRDTIYRRLNEESWSVNPSLHYNEWINLSPDEFRDVVDAWKDFYNLLHCDECQSLVRLGERRELLTCDCHKISWNVK